VLDLHGWGELHSELNSLSKRGDWQTMTTLIDDEVLQEFAVVGEPGAVGPALHERFGELVDRVTFYLPHRPSSELLAGIVDDVARLSNVAAPVAR
jgi:hypothetical protein